MDLIIPYVYWILLIIGIYYQIDIVGKDRPQKTAREAALDFVIQLPLIIYLFTR